MLAIHARHYILSISLTKMNKIKSVHSEIKLKLLVKKLYPFSNYIKLVSIK